MRAWVVFLLVATALAGCTEPEPVDLRSQDAEPQPEPAVLEPVPEPEEEPEQEPEPAPAPNRRPTAGLAADVVSGDAPLNVTFTLEGLDPDGDDLTWTFDKEDDGTIDEQGSRLPATLGLTYGAGTHTARLVVYDGAATANATVVVEALGPPEPEAPTAPVQELTLAWPVGGSDLAGLVGAAPGPCTAGPLDGTAHASFLVDAASRGAPFAVTVAHGTLPEAVVGWGILYLDDGCTASEAFTAEGAAPLSGTVPAFATWAIAYSDGGGDVTVSYAAG